MHGKKITILYTNDIESVYEPIEAFWNNDIDYIKSTKHLIIPQLGRQIDVSRK